MARKTTKNHETEGDVIVARLSAMTLPATLKPIGAAFKKTHAALVAAEDAAHTARSTRDESLGAVSSADDELDAAVNLLADKMTGAQLGSRKNPFAGYTKYAPSDLIALAYATEAKEVLALVAKVKKAKPAADVVKALGACEKKANAVIAALAKVTKPQAAYAKALASRDALLPGWTKALGRLKKNAAAALFDDDGAYEALFAPPQAVQAPVHKRAKKPAATNGGAPVASAGATPPAKTTTSGS